MVGRFRWLECGFLPMVNWDGWLGRLRGCQDGIQKNESIQNIELLPGWYPKKWSGTLLHMGLSRDKKCHFVTIIVILQG